MVVYRRLLVAYTLNELTWAFGSLALALLVFRRTGSAVGAAAFFFSAQFLPALIAPALIAAVEQRSLRRVLPVLYAVEAAAFAALAWLTGRFALAPILALALLDGTAAVCARALTRAASVAALAPAGLLREGNAITNLSFSLSYMIGPLLAGVLLATGGTRAALLLNTALFAAIALTLALTRELPGATLEREPILGRLTSGLRYAARAIEVRRLLAIQFLAFALFTIATPVEVVFAERTLHAGATGYGLLLSAWGAGTVLGSAIFARWRALPIRALIVTGALLVAAGMLDLRE